MRFLRRSLIGVFMLAATLGLLAFAANTVFSALSDRLAEENRPRQVRERVFAVMVEPVVARDVTPVMTAFGELRSTRTLDIRAKASGTVVALHPAFEEGGRVQAGDLLVRVDQADALSTLEVASANMTEAESEVRDAKVALALAEDDLVAAQEQVLLREKALARQLRVLESGFGSDAQVETAELAAATARQSVLAKRQTRANTQSRVAQADINLSRQKIALQEAERALADTQIYAAFDGTLSGVSLVQGGLVAANEQLAQLIAGDTLEVSFRLSTAQYARLLENGSLINSDLQVRLSADGFDLTAPGVITRESAIVGEGQSGRLIFARLQGTAGFRPGDFVTVLVEEPALNDVSILPAAALGADGSVLVVNAEDRLERVVVDLLRRQGNDVIIRASGLIGKEVVAARTPLLGEGLKVRILRPAAQGEAATKPDMIELSEERRTQLIAFVEGNNRMPEDVKERLLSQLAQQAVPASTVERLESRMGG
ncbi:RND family efflux transporter MFP subunit [Actibacterium atlanticum]|uniref:RND family efflux transporter MFP subunit n=1 Tax=Actibacterium atlanticum TaxID=1461693 RepID=A0A058ZJ41_9RHOB|nr:HlyD family efflux transporter periplasmic adaptor subunit [Actibacterium atlanticum]KCV80806.1 RND family efflux transporter MFP subunit [Actibacterium atlanticum]